MEDINKKVVKPQVEDWMRARQMVNRNAEKGYGLDGMPLKKGQTGVTKIEKTAQERVLEARRKRNLGMLRYMVERRGREQNEYERSDEQGKYRKDDRAAGKQAYRYGQQEAAAGRDRKRELPAGGTKKKAGRKKQQRDPELIKKVQEMYAAGCTLRVIGEAIERTPSGARKILIESGYPMQNSSERKRAHAKERGKLIERTPEMIDKIQQMYKDGYGKQQIAEAVGVSSRTVINILVEEGCEKRTREEGMRAWGDKKIETRQAKIGEIIKLYENGKTMQEIGEAVGMSRALVRKTMEEMGYRKENRRPSTELEESEIAKIIEMYDAGKALTAISKELGIPYQKVEKTVNESGHKKSASERRLQYFVVHGKAPERTPELKKRIKQLHDEGKQWKEIGEEVGMTQGLAKQMYLEAMEQEKRERRT